MKRMTLFMSAAIALGLSACSSDDTIIDNGTNGNGIPSASLSYAPTRAAEVSAYSNGHRVAKKQQAVVSVSNVAPLDNALLESTAKVFAGDNDAVLPEEQDNLNITPTKPGVSNWTTNYLYVSDGKPFTLYPAYSGTNSHDIIGIYYYDEEGVKHEQDIFDNHGSHWGFYKDQEGIQITVEKGYKFGFYLRTTYGFNGTDRNNNHYGDIEETYYSNVNENKACSYESHYNLWENSGCIGNGVHSASFSYGGNTFFGFEDWEHHNSKFDLNDVVFMITSELSIKDQPKEEDKKPEVTPTPEPEPTPTPNPEPGEDPTPSVVAGNGSVEVNFSIYDRKYEANETKLSIHVRDTTDVTIVIPTPAEYYCPVDDMMIVQKHDIAQVYNTSSTVDMDINGNKVSLTTTYAKDGITISTNGINAEVLKYLRDTYGDGLTFEINSYFATERIDASGNKVAVTRDEIQEMLNRSTISFTNTPKFYLNAFGVINNAIIPNDCNVKPADATLFGDREGVEPEHGSTSYLYIWERK